MSRWLMAVAGTAALATACAQQEPLEREDVTPRIGERVIEEIEDRTLFSGNGFVDALGGRLDGAIGPATGLNNESNNIQFYDDGFTTNAYVTVQGANGAAMGIIMVQNGSIASFEAGDSVSTCQDDWNDPDSDLNNGGPAVFYTGCANDGAMDEGWEYDAPADCTTIEVDVPDVGAPEGTVATVHALAHWSQASFGEERTVKTTIHLTER